jgi:hypothetical protein
MCQHQVTGGGQRASGGPSVGGFNMNVLSRRESLDTLTGHSDIFGP